MASPSPTQGRKSPPGKSEKDKPLDFGFFPPSDSVLDHRYHNVTLRYWPSLLFVMPMLITFELGTYLRRHTDGVEQPQLVASYLLERLVDVFGQSGFYVPGLLMVAVLLACHLVARPKQPWKFDVFVLFGMLGESLVWTVPLFVIDHLVHTAALTASAGTAHNPWIDHVIRSFGAGIYEELVFRFICMNVLHLLLVDVGRLPRKTSAILVICISAVLFAAQHHPPLGVEPFETGKFVFRTLAGLYLAGIYVFRGFGIAAGCHSFYNVIVVTLAAISA